MRARIYKPGQEYAPIWEGELIETYPNEYTFPEGLLHSDQTYEWRVGPTLPPVPVPVPVTYVPPSRITVVDRIRRMIGRWL